MPIVAMPEPCLFAYVSLDKGVDVAYLRDQP